MNKGIGIFTFALGAAIGSFITWHVTKNKYEQILDEEAASFRKVLKQKSQKSKEEKTNETEQPDLEKTEEVKQYENVVAESGYVKYSSIKEKGGAKVEEKSRPYVIAPEEFDTIDGYDICELTYYADKVLVDNKNEVIEDVDFVIGSDSLTRFGEYEDDALHVRNDELKCDYEILLDICTYAEAQRLTRPGKTEE